MTKEDILDRVSEEDLFRHFFGDFKLGKLYKSPLRNEQIPSFNIYKGVTGLRYKDFGGEQGDIFQFIMEKESVNFTGSLALIVNEFNLDRETVVKRVKKYKSKATYVDIAIRKRFVWQAKEWPEFGEQIHFWEKYGITLELLKEYDTYNVEWCKFRSNNDKLVTRTARPFFPIYVYKYDDDPEVLRFYEPKETKGKMKFYGNTRSYDIFGLKQIKDKVPLAGLVAGQKDALSIYANTGIRCCALPSESAKLTDDHYQQMLEKAERWFILYDNDKTGMRKAQGISEEFKLDLVNIADITKLNDASLYFEDLLKKQIPEQLTQLIHDSIR